MTKKDKIKELLGVLDMDSDSQFWTIQKYLSPEEAELYDTSEISLADLAFRLRDEVKSKHEKEWYRACFIVDEGLFNPNGGRGYTEWHGAEAEHGILQRDPIHWIIAALITKELSK